jgi:hypothetical protein
MVMVFDINAFSSSCVKLVRFKERSFSCTVRAGGEILGFSFEEISPSYIPSTAKAASFCRFCGTAPRGYPAVPFQIKTTGSSEI